MDSPSVSRNFEGSTKSAVQDPKPNLTPDGGVLLTYIDRSELGGQGHFALKDVKPGHLILRLSRPLVGVPDTPRLNETCSNCFLWEPGSETDSQGEGAVRLKVCTGCKVVKYCGKKCQSESWKGCHKYECKIYAKIYPQILPNTVRLLVRLFVAKTGDQATVEEDPLRGLESHFDDFKNGKGEVWENLCLMAKMVKKASGTPMDEGFVVESFAKVSSSDPFITNLNLRARSSSTP